MIRPHRIQRKLNITIGINQEFEFAETGYIKFKIPYYDVCVNLDRGADKNISPTFNYHIVRRNGNVE